MSVLVPLTVRGCGTVTSWKKSCKLLTTWPMSRSSLPTSNNILHVLTQEPSSYTTLVVFWSFPYGKVGTSIRLKQFSWLIARLKCLRATLEFSHQRSCHQALTTIDGFGRIILNSGADFTRSETLPRTAANASGSMEQSIRLALMEKCFVSTANVPPNLDAMLKTGSLR